MESARTACKYGDENWWLFWQPDRESSFCNKTPYRDNMAHMPIQVYQREPRQTRLRICFPTPLCCMLPVIGSLHLLRLLNLMHVYKLRQYNSSTSSLLLISIIIVYAICAVSSIVVPDQPEPVWKIIFLDPYHQPTRDAGAGGLFSIIYLEVNPSLTGDSPKLCIYLYHLPA